MLNCNNKYMSEKLSETWSIHVKSEAFCSENMDLLRKSLSNDGKIWKKFTANSHW